MKLFPFKISRKSLHGLKFFLNLIPLVNPFFSFKLIINSLSRFIFQQDKSKIESLFEKKHKIIRKWLLNKYDKKIDQILDDYMYNAQIQTSDTIWVMWWQGEEMMPEVNKLCLNYLKKNNPNKKITLIHEKNYADFVEIPTEILVKLKKGIITRTHFSDIIRLNLLAQRGGVWIDNTVLCLDKVPEFFFKDDFSTIKPLEFKNISSVSSYRWTGFFIAGLSNVYYKVMAEVINDYNLKFNFLVDYLLIDYILDMLYIKSPQFKNQVDSISISNSSIFDLQSVLYEPFNRCTWDNLTSKTSFFKLSYKKKVGTKKGQVMTFFDYINSNK